MTGYVGLIEKATLSNRYFRKVLFTGKYIQLVVLSWPREHFSEIAGWI